MPMLEKGPRTYMHNPIEQCIGFQLNGSSAPTILRDGTNVASAKKMFTVARVSAGLYTISLDSKTVWPDRPFVLPHVEQAAAPTAPVKIHYVKNSWSQTARTFQVQIQTVGTTPAASDGDAADRVTILIKGGADTVGQDPA